MTNLLLLMRWFRGWIRKEVRVLALPEVLWWPPIFRDGVSINTLQKKYKTILKLLISFYYSVDVYTFQNLHFKSHAITLTNERQLLIWQHLWQDVLSSKQASRAESKVHQSKLGLYNKRQSVTACGYCFSFLEYIAIKKAWKLWETIEIQIVYP